VIIMNWIHSDARQIRKRMGSCRLSRRSYPAWIILCVILGFSPAVIPTCTANAQDKSNIADTGSNQAKSKKSTPLNYAGVSFKPGKIRDPFLNPLIKKAGSNGDQEVARGIPPLGITGTFIAEAVLKGISFSEDSRLAIVKGAGNRAYFLRVGDRLFDGYLKAIHRDSITLVRETKMRSGKTITQTVIKQLRTP